MGKYIYGIGFLVIAVLSAMLYMAVRDREDIERRYEDAVENCKAYSSQFSTSDARNKALRLTVDQLESYGDSVLAELCKVKDSLGIKDSELKSLQYVASGLSRTDTIVFRDTLFRSGIESADTVLSDEWYSLRVSMRYPSTMVVAPRFRSEKAIVAYTRRETVDPPKKFFLLRWFQKRHTVLYVEVVEKSPYVDSQDSRYVEIVE